MASSSWLMERFATSSSDLTVCKKERRFTKRIWRGSWSFPPCYDLVCSKIYLPHEDESALTLNGKRSRLRHSDFELLAICLRLDRKAADNAVAKIAAASQKVTTLISHLGLSEKMKRQMTEIVLSWYERMKA